MPTPLRRLAVSLLFLWLVSGCGGADVAVPDEEAEVARGPHGGRLLTEGGFSLELKLDESGAFPRLRAWPSRDGQPLDPDSTMVEVTLARLGGAVDRFALKPDGDSLAGTAKVAEPHSFDVAVTARTGGREYRFEYPSYEGRVTLPDEAAARARIAVHVAGPAVIRSTLLLRGRLVPNENAVAHIMPRFDGLAREVRKALWDPVAKDEVLVVVEGNESLHPYEVRSRIAGTVVAKDVAPGEAVSSSREMFVVADLRTVWADLDVYRQDFAALAVGQPVRIEAGGGLPPLESRLARLSPIGSLASQTMLARALVPNPDGLWRPGLFVTGEVTTGVTDAPVAVRAAAIQSVGGRDVVFVRVGDVFEARPVLLGQRDREHVQILSGLAAGDSYAGANSFILKADVGKSGASHDH